jgi:hypothetical protein
MNVNTPFLGGQIYRITSIRLIWEIANIRASVQDKACDLQEQRIMAQIVLHPQLMSNTNAPRLVVHLVNRQHIVLSTLFRQLVILMRYDSFWFDYQKTPSALVTTYKRRKGHISRQQFGNAPVSRYITISLSDRVSLWFVLWQILEHLCRIRPVTYKNNVLWRRLFYTHN